MSHKIEPAPTGRAACRGCKQVIVKGALRFAEEVPNPYSEDAGTSFRYWHLSCAAIKLASDVGEALARHDGPVEGREAIEALVREHARPEMPYVERAGSGRARCRACDATIKKGELRVVFERVFESPMGPTRGAAYAHPGCVTRYLEREIERGRPSIDRDECVRRVMAGGKLPEDELEGARRDMMREPADPSADPTRAGDGSEA